MKKFLNQFWLAGAAVSCLIQFPVLTPAAEHPSKDKPLFEMRTYYAAPGKWEALNARFRDHTVKLFAKHGMQNIGYWAPVDNPQSKLVYVLAYPNREARDKSWKEFMADPDWQKAYRESEVNGKLVDKAESVFLLATDYSPEIKPMATTPARVFELRTYKSAPGKLPDLNARFRDHTVKLFAKHGMTQVGYWTPVDPKQGADDTLIYLLAHRSREAAAESFNTFRADPEWIAARKASEEKAGGALTLPDGVKSEFMAPVDYSPMR
jgi:hypothetical protein